MTGVKGLPLFTFTIRPCTQGQTEEKAADDRQTRPRCVDFILVGVPLDELICTGTPDCPRPEDCPNPDPCAEDLECNEGHVEAAQAQAETLGATNEANRLAAEARERAGSVDAAVLDLVTRLEAFDAIADVINAAAQAAKERVYQQVFGADEVPVAVDVVIDAGLIYVRPQD